MLLRKSDDKKTATAGRNQQGQLLRHLGIIADQACEGIIVVDLRGVLHFVNTAWTRMHGYETGKELLGRQISMFHTPEEMKSKLIPLSERAKRDGSSTGTVKHLRKDGTKFTTKAKMVPLADEQGNTNGLIIYVIDTTEFKQRENTLEEAAEQAEDSELMDGPFDTQELKAIADLAKRLG
jgi:PAS domain S-box-containing protein